MNIPFHDLRPEQIARLILWLPELPPEKHKFWHKREMRIRPSRCNKPRMDEIKRMALATDDLHWQRTVEEHADEFPVIGIAHGPLLRNREFISNPITLQVNEPPGFEYRRSRFQYDMTSLMWTKALLWRAFVKGQLGEGPRVDGVVYLRADKLLDLEMKHCKVRFEHYMAIRRQRRVSRRIPMAEIWDTIGRDSAVAAEFRRNGFKTRFIGVWQVKRGYS